MAFVSQRPGRKSHGGQGGPDSPRPSWWVSRTGSSVLPRLPESSPKHPLCHIPGSQSLRERSLPSIPGLTLWAPCPSHHRAGSGQRHSAPHPRASQKLTDDSIPSSRPGFPLPSFCLTDPGASLWCSPPWSGKPLPLRN